MYMYTQLARVPRRAAKHSVATQSQLYFVVEGESVGQMEGGREGQSTTKASELQPLSDRLREYLQPWAQEFANHYLAEVMTFLSMHTFVHFSEIYPVFRGIIYVYMIPPAYVCTGEGW